MKWNFRPFRPSPNREQRDQSKRHRDQPEIKPRAGVLASCGTSIGSPIVSWFLVRQLGSIRRDPPRLVLAEQFGSCATSYEGGVALHRRVYPNSRSGV
jgi:hypothetical protein